MKKLILAVVLAGTLLTIPALVSASGFVFALPKKEPYIKPTTQQASIRSNGSKAKVEKKCDPSYPTVCLNPGLRGLSCRDIGFANFRVVGRDPHGFDRDRDGIGCEAFMRR